MDVITRVVQAGEPVDPEDIKNPHVRVRESYTPCKDCVTVDGVEVLQYPQKPAPAEED